MPRDLDLVVWGATGFTGELAVAYLKGDASKIFSFDLKAPAAPADLRWAIAGRNKSKLEALGAGVEIIACDSSDEAIEAMVRRTKVVVGFAGPFVKYSDRVVAACAKFGTHWCDITGEVAWHRSLLDRFGDRAKGTGACIVSHCGYDSIPSDLGALFAVHALRSRAGPGTAVQSVACYHLMQGGSFSGGSLATQLEWESNPVALSTGVDLDHPFLLGGETAAGVRDTDMFPYPNEPTFSDELQAWTAPFGMAQINARVVRRSSSLLGYGGAFAYTEVQVMPKGEKQAAKATQMLVSPPPPEVLRQLIEGGTLPKPGEGPAPKVRRTTRFLALLIARGAGGEEAAVAVRGGEGGYEETAKMCVEAGLALACEGATCPGVVDGGGFRTPAAAMGHTLINRLHRAGITFDVLPTGGAPAAPAARAALHARMGRAAKL